MGDVLLEPLPFCCADLGINAIVVGRGAVEFGVVNFYLNVLGGVTILDKGLGNHAASVKPPNSCFESAFNLIISLFPLKGMAKFFILYKLFSSSAFLEICRRSRMY